MGSLFGTKPGWWLSHLPLWKIWQIVSWDDEIHWNSHIYIWKVIKVMFQTTNQLNKSQSWHMDLTSKVQDRRISTARGDSLTARRLDDSIDWLSELPGSPARYIEAIRTKKSLMSWCQRLFQEPIHWRYRFHFYKAYLLGLNFREYPQKIWPYMVRTYLHFRILKFPLMMGVLQSLGTM